MTDLEEEAGLEEVEVDAEVPAEVDVVEEEVIVVVEGAIAVDEEEQKEEVGEVVEE